ncbi:MAG TPA: DinB family protein [Candidatus Cybelea sp.]|nr:DinB family protein [Candidatus Cybelea sp.]
MTAAERQRAIIWLEESRERLLRTTRGLSREQLQHKPAPDRWSIAEILEHVAFVEGRILAGIDRALQRPSTVPHGMDDDTMVEKAVDRTARLRGPDVVAPSGRWPHDKLLSEFESVRKRSIEFAKTTTRELREHSYSHPFFGELDCYQWLLLIPAHGERHRMQAEEVIADAGFPRSPGTQGVR